MTPPADALDAAIAIAARLETDGLPYAIGGALAYGIWAVPRATLDVDVNVFVEPKDYGRVLTRLEGIGVSFDRTRALREGQQSGLMVGYWGDIRIDVFVPSIDFSWEAMRTRVQHAIEGHSLYFLSAEATAVFKLLFFRGKDRVDLERLVAVQGEKLDAAYVRTQVSAVVGSDDERVREWDTITARNVNS